MISVRLDPQMESRLNYYAAHFDVSKSKIIKESLMHYFEFLQKKEIDKTPYEVGKDLFGKYGSEKGDLSVTYKKRIKEKLRAKSAHR